jgi:hypothetical protein
MTSNVKSDQLISSGCHDVFYPRCIGKAAASKKRRLMLLLAVAWLPPYLLPSGVCSIYQAHQADVHFAALLSRGLWTALRGKPHRGINEGIGIHCNQS